MSAPLTLSPSGPLRPLDTNWTRPASCQESAPSVYSPITQLAGNLELLLLGFDQASIPQRLGNNTRLSVRDDGGSVSHRHQPLQTIITVGQAQFRDNGDTCEHVVNAATPDYPHSLSPFLHHARSEIAPAQIPTNYPTTRPVDNHRRSFTHSFGTPLSDSPSSLRPLTTAVDASPQAMTTIISTPGSPPDLSGSRSSKSSSYCSTSQESNHDGIVTDVMNFEDIGLDDETISKNEESQKLALHRSRTTDDGMGPAHSDRGQRPVLPGLHHQIREAVKQKENAQPLRKGPVFPSMRRGFSSPVGPFPASRPRSTSPPKTTQSSTTLSADRLRPHWNGTRSSLPLPARRNSWQQRKSILELEAEYHDSDDELPEDASLWNVPVSPHIGDRSARSSFHGSPAREPIPRSPRPVPLPHANPPFDYQRAQTPTGQLNPPRQRTTPPRSSSLTTSISNPSSPRSQRFQRAGRAKSWNLAMEDLSEEAKIISEALEHHAEQSRRARGDISTPTSGVEPLGDNGNPKASQIQLPPIQKGSLDFMPISKEKEAILSRTRPSWLPPKDPREERRHLREYQQMMAASMEAEKKRQQKTQSSEWEKDNTRDALNRIWEYYCEDTTDLTVIDKRVFDLCWRGISPKLRGKVWQRAIGNSLGLTIKSYEKALSRAREIQNQDATRLSSRERHMRTWFKDIERDAETAFPELNLFQRDGPLWQDLIDVCTAYSCYRSDIGYLYGQQLTAALLLLQVQKPAEAFILLANCFNKPIPLAFQTGDISTMARTYNHAMSTLAIKFPRLHDYLFGSIEDGGLGFTAELIFEPMIRTLFSNGLDIDRLCRFWDLWVFKGDNILVRTAVATLGCLQTQILDVQGDIDLRRRNIQEMLAWGPFNRSAKGGHWDLGHIEQDKFVGEVRAAGELDYRLK